MIILNFFVFKFTRRFLRLNFIVKFRLNVFSYSTLHFFSSAFIVRNSVWKKIKNLRNRHRLSICPLQNQQLIIPSSLYTISVYIRLKAYFHPSHGYRRISQTMTTVLNIYVWSGIRLCSYTTKSNWNLKNYKRYFRLNIFL